MLSPDHFTYGLLEGLFIDTNGYVRSLPWAVAEVSAICRDVDGVDEILQEISEAIESADYAYVFDQDIRASVAAVLSEQTAELRGDEQDPIGTQLDRLAQLINPE